MKIVFFGSKNVEPIIRSLKANFNLCTVVTTLGGMEEYSKIEKIPYQVTSSLDDSLINGLKELKADVGVVANFRLILPREILEIFPKGVLNVHPSLLPKYRGPTPIQSAILNGDKKTGVSVIIIDEKVDHGAILRSFDLNLNTNDTFESLYKVLFEKAADTLPEIIEQYDKGQIELKKQDDSQATYTPKLSKEDGYFDSSKPPEKEKLQRMIRAYYPWPGVWTKFALVGEKELIIKFLPDKKIQVEGKKETSYSDFINGYPLGRQLLDKLLLS